MQAVRRRRAFAVLEGDRRRMERRGVDPRMRFPERRTGFDRRRPSPTRRTATFLANGVRVLRDEPWRMLVLLGGILALGVLDLLFTVDALASGATEANPLMAGLLAADVRLAAVVKGGVTLAVVAGLWRLRAYRKVIEATLLIVAGMLVLIAYHLVLRAYIA